MFDLEIADVAADDGPETTVAPGIGSSRPKLDDLKVGLPIAIAFLPMRLFLAAGWLRAAAEKVPDPAWWNGEVVTQFVADQRAESLSFFKPVLVDLILPNAVAVSAIVVVSQIFVGLALLVGRRLSWALRAGMVMNVAFVLSGLVNPSVFYLVMEIGLLYAVASGWLGHKPPEQQRSPMLVAAGWVIVGLVLAQWIQTIEPAGVIDDPAIVLAFLCLILAVGSVLRSAIARDLIARLDSGVTSRVIHSWLFCRSVDRPAKQGRQEAR